MNQLLTVSVGVLSLITLTVAGTSYNYLDEKQDNSNINFNQPFDASYYLEMSCPKKLPIDRLIVRRAEACLEKTLNDEIVAKLLIMASVREFQKFSTKICKQWPHIRICLDEIISYLESCHEKSYIGQVTDEIVNYVCTDPISDNVDTNNLGDFLTAGGLSCTNFDVLASCMKFSLDQSISFCTMTEKIRSCSKPAFDGCDTSKPWDVIEKGLGEQEAIMRCGTPEENGVSSAAPSLNSINK
ncbi:hypothetical protein Ocin01_04514 [Orchesella cincta]|uniref:Secreted protein n=1 Tax=Orchesella cincta TaxID=48709 RepID=A0A1D2NA96_ORCCI|nr:hypothetical protein Ocin01_04514 [Orchesella cincta]